MDIYLVIGYFKYEGCEPLGVYSTLNKAITRCKKEKGWDGTQVLKYTVDSEKEEEEVYTKRNKT